MRVDLEAGGSAWLLELAHHLLFPPWAFRSADTLHTSPRCEAVEQKPREDSKLSQLLLPTQGLAPWGGREGTPQPRAELG